MIILDFSLIITVLFSKSAEGKVWNDITADVNKNLINKKLSPCRSPIDIENVLVWSGILGVDDMNVCIYEALADIEVPIEADKTIAISFDWQQLKTQHSQSHCAASTSPFFSKEDTFMIIRTSKDATISVYDHANKCKNNKNSDLGGHEVNTTGQVNSIKSSDLGGHAVNTTGQVNSIKNSDLGGHEVNTTGQVNSINRSDLGGHKGNTIGQVNNITNELRPRSDLDEKNNPSTETTNFYMILLGPFCGFFVLVLFCIMILAVYCRRKKKEPNKRRTYGDIFGSVRINVSLRRAPSN